MTARLATHPSLSDRTTDVVERLEAAGIDVDVVGRARGGDTIFDPLDAVRDSTIDLALVGLSALRGSAYDDLTTVAVLPRDEVRDVLVTVSGSPTVLAELSAGARVGASGARRLAFLAAHRRDVVGVSLDVGAVARSERTEGDLRVALHEEHGLDAVVMSALDARFFGLMEVTTEALEPKAWLPEPGQGAMALVARHPIAEATAVDHLPTRTALRCELALLEALDAGSDEPLGCLAQPSGRWIRLWAAIASPDGRRLVRSDLTGPLDEPEGLGRAVAGELEGRGYRLVALGAES